jgi:uncharacterized protein YecT (DUF1311 family)
MTDWNEVSDKADNAYQELDTAHKSLDDEINNLYTAALADEVYSPEEKSNIAAKREAALALLAERDAISSAALDALDANKDVQALKSMFEQINQRLEGIGSELDEFAAVTGHVDSAVGTIGEILELIG